MRRGAPIYAAVDQTLAEGWSLAVAAAGDCAHPSQAAQLGDWTPTSAPVTAARVLAEAGRQADAAGLHAKDVWWRRPLMMRGPCSLVFEGLATLVEVWIDDQRVLATSSMHLAAQLDLDLRGDETLWVVCRALTPALQRKLPRARWRPRMMDDQGLRGVRTTLLGRMPGWTPPVHAVGPFRPVMARLAQRVELLALRSTLEDGAGQVSLVLHIDGPIGEARVRCAGREAELTALGGGLFAAALCDLKVSPWWPHTHGAPTLYDLILHLDDDDRLIRRVGFRQLALDRGADGVGFGLRINDEAVFCRGAVWTSADLVGLGCARETYRPALEQARAAGMNMIRLSGVGVYEAPAFYDLCDELGLMVWQDLMLANFDYPTSDPALREALEAELDQLLLRLAGRPGAAVLCGGSEIHQQAAMLGLPAAAWGDPFLEDFVPAKVAEAGDLIYLPNTPFGGPMPFSPEEGVVHYYGVGAYRRGLDDLRRANVRFASECLAFANVPQRESLKGRLEAAAVHSPEWKAGVPRDRGASWDFEDVRDHYLGLLYEVDPSRLRLEQTELYLDLSRAVSADLMTAALSEWRRPGSSCQGALVWTLMDLRAGAGWGLLDDQARPKPAYYGFRRAAQPLHLGLTDEGLNGLAIHLVNETSVAVEAQLVLRAWRDGQLVVLKAQTPVSLAPRSAQTVSAAAVCGAFFDLTYAYRFGPPPADLVWAGLVAPGTPDGPALAEAFHFPLGRRAPPQGGEVRAVLHEGEGAATLDLVAPSFVGPVRLQTPGFEADDDWFCLAPNRPRAIRLTPLSTTAPQARTAKAELVVWGPGGRRLAQA